VAWSVQWIPCGRNLGFIDRFNSTTVFMSGAGIMQSVQRLALSGAHSASYTMEPEALSLEVGQPGCD
jgi:hypothetical protein